MDRKFYTIDDLYNFCRENHFETFSSKKQGAPLIVQSFGTFESVDNTNDGLLTVKLKSCHTGKNRNKSGISDATMELYKNSFKGRPILGAIYKTDTGEYEFRAHDMEIVEDGDDVDINYIEQPIGVISQIDEPYLEFDEDAQKNYLMVNGTIFSDYSKAAEILERRRTCKCSVEIAVEEMSYNCTEDYLSIDKFHFCGVTILGYKQDGITEIQEGMAGSKITIDDFSVKKNSMFAEGYTDKMIEILEKLNTTLSNFNLNNKKGGDVEMNKFEELLTQYGKTIEDITFDVDGLSDEELETKFAEVFEDNSESDESDDGNIESNTNDDEGTTGEENSNDGEGENVFVTNKKYSVDDNGNATIVFEISHEDIRGALYNLLRVYDEQDNEWYFVTNVYDDYFIFENWEGNKLYKQSYSIDGDNVALSGDRQEMFKMILTESEKLAIDQMRENYSALESEYNALKEFKDNYEATQLHTQRKAILDAQEYSVLAETEEFKALVKDMDQYSVDELTIKADLIFAKFAKTQGAFANTGDDSNKPKIIGFASSQEKDNKPYGDLFN